MNVIEKKTMNPRGVTVTEIKYIFGMVDLFFYGNGYFLLVLISE